MSGRGWRNRIDFLLYRARRLGSLRMLAWYRDRLAELIAIARARLGDDRDFTPLSIQIEPTTKCNLKCTYCELTYMKEAGTHLPLERVREILDRLPRLRNVNVTGHGEPLLNRAFMDIVALLKARGIRVSFVDNFTIMGERKANQLVELGLDRLYISVDSADKGIFETLRAGAKFEKVVRNIRAFVEVKKARDAKVPELGFIMVVTAYNFSEMPKVIAMADELDIPFVELTHVVTWDETGDQEAGAEDAAIRSALAEAIEEGRRRGVIVYTDLFEIEKKPVQQCSFFWDENYITVDGYVHPCYYAAHARRGERFRALDWETTNAQSLGNIFEQSYAEIWNGPEFVKARREAAAGILPDICDGCPRYHGKEADETRRRRLARAADADADAVIAP